MVIHCTNHPVLAWCCSSAGSVLALVIKWGLRASSGKKELGNDDQSLSLLNQAGRKMEETEVTAAPRSSSKDRLSESSTHSLSGRGYSVSDIFTLCGFTAELQYPLLPFMAPAADILIMLNREMVES
ncbi:hypothetical protein QQF64_026679 [Cirrhinus molitorella]|uniref:Uncharacterized protein n=1 Tax=Cirrhinus molitorella TaxID=172907 RepID=A0ABR3NAX3_9TELE